MSKINCTPLFLEFEVRFEPYDTPPPPGYEVPKNKETGEPPPNCCKPHQELFRITSEWFDKFPMCCEHHTDMAEKEKWFHKDQFKELPTKIVKQVSFMEFHIKNVIQNPDWFEDIADYFNCNIKSFGSFEIGLSQFMSAVNHVIKSPSFNIPKKKREILIGHFNTYSNENKKERQAQTDFNLLESTYRKWLSEFPFEFEIFKDLKPKYQKTFPIVREWGKTNRYTGHQIVIIHTKETMLAQLEAITERILTEINSLVLHEEGNLTDLNQYELGLVTEQRRLKIKAGYRNNTATDPGYRKVLKEWLQDEKQFIRELKPLINGLPPQPLKSNSELLNEHLNQYGFFELEKVKGLSAQRKSLLVEKISEQGLPYAVAMFDYLQFFKFLAREHFPVKHNLNKEVSKWFEKDKDGRAVKGNISSLLKSTTENKERYTAHLHKETVINYYENLK